MKTRLPILLALAAALVPAQDYRGRLQGVVTDPANAAVAQATVTLTNSNTKTATVRMTDEPESEKGNPSVIL